MKHLFIINPHAGAHSHEKQIQQAIAKLPKSIDYTIYTKQQKGDSYQVIRNFRLQHPDEEIRVYACGGDGTLNEVAAAVVGLQNVAFTSYACGSGNDYIKYYGQPQLFRNIENLINGTPHPIDIMRVNNTYALNATHFGLDYKVARVMNQLRRNILIGKRLCYPSAIAWVFLTGMTDHCKVYADGKLINSKDEILLCTVANGKYVGGSYCCAPRSSNNDGWLEVCLIKPVALLKVLQLMDAYKKGKHLEDQRFKKYIHYCRAKKIKIEGGKNFGVSLDGEPTQGNLFDVEILPRAAMFIEPATSLTQTKR